MLLRTQVEMREKQTLRPSASFSADAVRKVNIADHNLRTTFQRDRDRILHCKAFRRLEHKTQVFLTEQGDHIRTRLTHSLEVAQLARTAAQVLGLNGDLAEAIALGHDLGHTPFGHAGERALMGILKEHGVNTFKHNVQSVRIVEELERKYAYDGLGLTRHVREGILKHTGLPEELPDCCSDLFIENECSVTLEGQLVSLCDEIAQITHDMDDYLRFNIVQYSSLCDHKLFSNLRTFYKQSYGNELDSYLSRITDEDREKDAITRCLVDYLVSELVSHTDKQLTDDLRSMGIDRQYVCFESETERTVKSFKSELHVMMTSDHRVSEMDDRGAHIVRRLFDYFLKHPSAMPESTYKKFRDFDGNKVTVIADYISGMTDRYALGQYQQAYALG